MSGRAGAGPRGAEPAAPGAGDAATAAALDARGFVDFLRYASLGDAGDGAAPGRAALLGDGAAAGLWAELRAGGYATFAARDACPDGRPALPDADYGAALRAACCSDGDGDPPHCLWGTAAARLLLSHYEQFARAYGPGGGRPRVPTASLLVFVDADEDSLALAASLDAPLSSLLGGIEMHCTAVVLLSHRGMDTEDLEGNETLALRSCGDDGRGRRLYPEPARGADGVLPAVDRGVRTRARPAPRRRVVPPPRPPGTGGNMTSLFATAARAGYVTFFGEEFCYTGSPYVVQDHFFPVAPNVSLLPLFCRLAEDTQRRQGNASAPLWSVEWGPCVHGRPRAALALEHLRGLWDARTAAMPAFAFLNARAAHDYAADEARRYARAEAYDALLAAFLRGLLADHGRDTVVVVRSDHGRQGGPARREHAAQAEHVLVVPGRVPTTVVRRNADAALVTGFD
eukprot:CAMPEP_0194345252 /NCGR_PEP_ID=MMETSP0171-20130528/104750_1 /TAXON_ID=218684 /ORGANISM="Corethron pennatum, Strain L29A3" /LENGTH=456 /DNA_ID=CAMNT_0039112213 /DNA_START=111 /DNA_END=1480 /DNA_ORIENTATION=-